MANTLGGGILAERISQRRRASSSGGQFSIQDAIARISAARDAASEASEARYQGLLGGVDVLKEETAGMYDASNLAAIAGIGESATRAQASGEQGLISRGLGSTTIRGAMTRGVQADREKAELAQRGQYDQQRGPLAMALGQMRSGIMERRTDAGPDMGIYASLMQQAAAGEQAGIESRRGTTAIAPSRSIQGGFLTRLKQRRQSQSAPASRSRSQTLYTNPIRKG